MTNIMSADEIFDLFQIAFDTSIHPQERFDAANKGFDNVFSVQWDDRHGIQTADLYYTFMRTKAEFLLANFSTINDADLEGLIEAFERFLAVELDTHTRCYLSVHAAELYVRRIKEETVEQLSHAHVALQKLCTLDDKVVQSYPWIALVFIKAELIKEKLYNITRSPEYKTDISRVESWLKMCLIDEDDEFTRFDAFQLVGEYYLLTLQGNHADNVERALEIFKNQDRENKEKPLPSTHWCKIIEKLGDAYALRIRGDKYENIQNALNFYNGAVEFSDNNPNEEYPRKQKSLNFLKTMNMFVERNRLEDACETRQLVFSEKKDELFSQLQVSKDSLPPKKFIKKNSTDGVKQVSKIFRNQNWENKEIPFTSQDFYKILGELTDTKLAEEYSGKENFHNILRTANMFTEASKINDVDGAVELNFGDKTDEFFLQLLESKDKEGKIQFLGKYICYLSYVSALIVSKANTLDKASFQDEAFHFLNMIQENVHLECSARFRFEAKILAANILLQSSHPRRKEILEQKYTEFQEILKTLDPEVFPEEYIRIHTICSEILRNFFSKKNDQQQLTHLESAQKVAEKYELTHHLSKILLGLSKVHTDRRSEFFNADQAIKYCKKSITYINKIHQLDELIHGRLHLAAIYGVIEDWKAVSMQSDEIIDLINVEKEPEESEYILRIINEINWGLYAPLIVYSYLTLDNIEKGLAVSELLKIESIHHKLLYEMDRIKAEDRSKPMIDLIMYQWFARYKVTGTSQSYEMDDSAKAYLDNARTLTPELKEKYRFAPEIWDISEQLDKLEEWVLIPVITLTKTRYILISPYEEKQLIIRSDPTDFVSSNFIQITVSWIDAIIALRNKDSEGAKKFDELIPKVSILLYAMIGYWISKMIIKYDIPKNTRFVVIPFGQIANLPIGLTPLNEEGTLLQDYFTLSIAPSITAINGIRNRLRKINENTLTHVYVPEDELEYGTLERSIISTFLEDSNIQNHEAIDSEALFSSTKLFDSKYLHFQLHGEHNFRYSQEPALALMNGQNIKPADLAKIAPQQFQRVVTLTSCEAGMADFYKGGGAIHGFPTVMLLMGAIGVIAPIWEVSNAATCILMIRFYEKHFVEKLPPPQALKDAQLWIREATTDDIIQYIENHANHDDPTISEKADKLIFELEKLNPDAKPFAAPQYWAAFVYFGL